MNLFKQIWSPILPFSNAVMAPADYAWKQYEELPQLSNYELPHERYAKTAKNIGEVLVGIIPFVLAVILDSLIGASTDNPGPFQRAIRKLKFLPTLIVGTLFQLLAKLAFYVIPAIFTNTADFLMRVVVGAGATVLSAVGLALETTAIGLASGAIVGLVALAVAGVAAVVGIGTGVGVTAAILYPFYWAGKKLFGSKKKMVISTEDDFSDTSDNEQDTYYPNSNARIRSNLRTNKTDVSNSFSYNDNYNEEETENLINNNNNNIESASSENEVDTGYVPSISNKI